jgi:uncharacterized glyoxalase superfamily protein PhnB
MEQSHLREFPPPEHASDCPLLGCRVADSDIGKSICAIHPREHFVAGVLCRETVQCILPVAVATGLEGIQMTLKRIVPLMAVPDIEKAIEFYRQMLGFEFVNQMEIWALVQKDGVELMFALLNAHVPFDKPHFTGSLYFDLDDVGELWEKLKDTATVFYPSEDFSYGMREFAIQDNNGYILQFGQDVSERVWPDSRLSELF